MKKLIWIMMWSFLIIGISFWYSDMEDQVHWTTNFVRQMSNLSQLQHSQILEDIARDQCEYLNRTNTMWHYRLYDITPAQRFQPLRTKTNSRYYGENISRNYFTPVGVVRARWNSPTHRAVMTNPVFTHLGIAQVDEYICQAYWAFTIEY